MTKGQTSKLEARKKKKAAAPAQRRQRALPAGWIQGDFLPSTVTVADMLELVEQGLIENKSWRLPAEGETESAPREDERVLLLSHLYRGFSLPPHPFFRGIMNHFGAQLHHFPPNAIAHLSAFVVLCECFIGCPPHWGLFKHIFSAKSQTIKRLSQSNDKTHLLQRCGGLGFQNKSKSSYPALQLSESVRNSQSTWFYCEDVACPNAATGLPPFSLDRPAPPRQLALTKMEKIQIQPLVDALVDVVRKGVTDIDLLDVFLGQRIEPLQARHHAMWHYTGREDSTRTHPECVTGEVVTAWVRAITRACDNPRGARRVKPFRADNPPPNEAWTNWYSPVSNGNPTEEEEGSQKGSVESAEYVSDSGETEESEEEEGEGEEQSSPPPPPEPRTKRRHEPVTSSAPPVAPSAPSAPVTPSAPPAAQSAPSPPPVVPSALPATPVSPSARSTKRTRDTAAEPAGQPSKVAKPSGSKPRKALPRMRIAVHVASTAATSATSPPRQEGDPMYTDNVATSQQVGLPSEVIHVEEDDQKRSEQAAVPVLEAVPSATTPAMDVPPAETMSSTETALIGAEPTGTGLGMPKESLVVPGPSTFEYDAQRLPEDQVGAAKGAMVQAELMAGDAKRAYDSIASVYKRSLELREDIRKTCEMGSAYNALKAEKVQLAAQLEAALHDLVGVKGALAEREKSPEESREANKALVAEMEKMGKQRTELMGQMKVMNRRCIAQEKYVSDWATKMIALLGDFCMDAEAEAADVERSVIPNVSLGEDANRDMLRAHIRLGKVGPFIGRLREVVGRIDKELWPEDESRQEMEGLMTRLEDVPNRVPAWKKSAARSGADVALSLVRVHYKEAREEKLKALQVANTKKL
ncbi:hypothetical protein ZWY2020_042844 [Hordeum vulgare]|nr:hypothetical protein ZWY2020_042844 [Hordeum vulgare]